MDKIIQNTINFDVNYDFLEDNEKNIPKYDPDQHSKTLQNYHQILWSKEENNIKFNFEASRDPWNNNNLVLINKYGSDTKQKIFSSDWIINHYQDWPKNKFPKLKYLDNVDNKIKDDFRMISTTIGGRIIFPKRLMDGLRESINTHRGKHPRIRDRFDITLECIRRYFIGQESIPEFDKTLKRYDFFFILFGKSTEGFKNYCDFFLLQDLVSEDLAIKPFLDFQGFNLDPYPKCEQQYLEFVEKATNFIKNRNKRIQEYWNNRKM